MTWVLFSVEGHVNFNFKSLLIFPSWLYTIFPLWSSVSPISFLGISSVFHCFGNYIRINIPFPKWEVPNCKPWTPLWTFDFPCMPPKPGDPIKLKGYMLWDCGTVGLHSDSWVIITLILHLQHNGASQWVLPKTCS